MTGKAQQPQVQHYPFLSVCAAFPCVQTMVWLSAFGIFSVCTDVDARDCSQGLYGHHEKKSALTADLRREIRCCVRDSNSHQYCAWLFSQDTLPNKLVPFFISNMEFLLLFFVGGWGVVGQIQTCILWHTVLPQAWSKTLNIW